MNTSETAVAGELPESVEPGRHVMRILSPRASLSTAQRQSAKREAREAAENLDRLKRQADEWIARQQSTPETPSDASELLADTTPTVHPAIAEAA